MGSDLGKMGFSIPYTKHTNSTTVRRSDEWQGYWLFPKTCTEWYAKKKISSHQIICEGKITSVCKICDSTWCPIKCYTDNGIGVRAQLPHILFSLLKEILKKKEVQNIYKKEHSFYRAVEVCNSTQICKSEIWQLRCKK